MKGFLYVSLSLSILPFLAIEMPGPSLAHSSAVVQFDTVCAVPAPTSAVGLRRVSRTLLTLEPRKLVFTAPTAVEE